MKDNERIKLVVENLESIKNTVKYSDVYKGLPASAAVLICSHMIHLEKTIRKLIKYLGNVPISKYDEVTL